MRLRNVKNAKEIINDSKTIVFAPDIHKGSWSVFFQNENPIYLEIGMGKGDFLLENALKYPNINFIGVEKFDKVIVKAIKKIEKHNLNNLKLIRMDALKLDEVFDKEISTIYLNFSDPWPKKRHIKRRLTSDYFLEKYEKLFKDKKIIILKTDNYLLYEFSKEQFTKYNYQINELTFDYENMPTDNIMTEYEKFFLEKGNSIYKIIAFKDQK